MTNKLGVVQHVVVGIVLVSIIMGSVLMHSPDAFGGALLVSLATLFLLLKNKN